MRGGLKIRSVASIGAGPRDLPCDRQVRSQQHGQAASDRGPTQVSLRPKLTMAASMRQAIPCRTANRSWPNEAISASLKRQRSRTPAAAIVLITVGRRLPVCIERCAKSRVIAIAATRSRNQPPMVVSRSVSTRPARGLAFAVTMQAAPSQSIHGLRDMARLVICVPGIQRTWSGRSFMQPDPVREIAADPLFPPTASRPSGIRQFLRDLEADDYGGGQPELLARAVRLQVLSLNVPLKPVCGNGILVVPRTPSSIG